VRRTAAGHQGLRGVNAAILTDSGSLIRRNSASRSESCTGRSITVCSPISFMIQTYRAGPTTSVAPAGRCPPARMPCLLGDLCRLAVKVTRLSNALSSARPDDCAQPVEAIELPPCNLLGPSWNVWRRRSSTRWRWAGPARPSTCASPTHAAGLTRSGWTVPTYDAGDSGSMVPFAVSGSGARWSGLPERVRCGRSGVAAGAALIAVAGSWASTARCGPLGDR
jgi:hypothetical protein